MTWCIIFKTHFLFWYSCLHVNIAIVFERVYFYWEGIKMVQHDVVGFRQQGRVTLQRENKESGVSQGEEITAVNNSVKGKLNQECESMDSRKTLTDMLVSLLRMTWRRCGGRMGGALRCSSGLKTYCSCPYGPGGELDRSANKQNQKQPLTYKNTTFYFCLTSMILRKGTIHILSSTVFAHTCPVNSIL